jgi:4-hydroxy-4-methyl-2-oxoglutarate aldolase
MTISLTPSANVADYGTAVLYDAGKRLNLEIGLEAVSPLAPGLRLAAPAFTVRFAPRNEAPATALNFYDIIDEIPKGRALIVEVGADRWIFGANTTRFAQLSGLAGIIIDGCVRDVASIRESGFPVFARGASVVSCKGSLVLHSFGGEIRCSGATVRTNDIIVADDDGVVCVPAACLDDIIYEAEEIAKLDTELARVIELRRPLSELHETLKRWSIRRVSPESVV